MSGVSIYSPYNNISAKEKLLLSEATAYSLAKCLQKTSKCHSAMVDKWAMFPQKRWSFIFYFLGQTQGDLDNIS